MELQELQELEDLQDALDTSENENKILVVDCFTKWCGPCKILTPILEELAGELNYVTFVKVNVGESDDFADYYQITSIPTLTFYVNGKVVDTTKGLMSKDEMKDKLKELKKLMTNEENDATNVDESDKVMCEEVVAD